MRTTPRTNSIRFAQSEPARARAGRLDGLFLASLTVAAGLVGYSFGTGHFVQGGAPGDAGATVSLESEVPITAGGLRLQTSERNNIELFRRTSPAVVNIVNRALVRQGGMFRTNLAEATQGTGTGFVWDEQGHVVTNYHVVHESHRLFVTLHDQSQWEATVVGAAPHKDLAVLRIEAPKTSLVPLGLGDSSSLAVGQNVYAIGNPFGLDQTLTTGIVSGLGREIRSMTNHKITDVIQTDAAINPGNSGGPLLNSAGHLVGVNTAIYSPSGAYAGIGFAVPVDDVKRAVPEMIERGSVRRPGLGFVPVSSSIGRRMGIQGVGIAEVNPGSAAETAGLRSARRMRDGRWSIDVIVAIDDNPIRREEDLFDALDAREIGETVDVVVQRGGQTRTVAVQLQGLD